MKIEIEEERKLTREERRASRTYLAIVARPKGSKIWTTGWVLDLYPNERKRYRANIKTLEGDRVLGEFSSWEEAFEKVGDFLKAQAARLKTRKAKTL